LSGPQMVEARCVTCLSRGYARLKSSQSQGERVSRMGYSDDYLASKDDSELRDMRDSWALDSDELEALNDELELRGIPTEPSADSANEE
jgi:hypothetical protein